VRLKIELRRNGPVDIISENYDVSHARTHTHTYLNYDVANVLVTLHKQT